jgi:uncharacterized protein YecE (DUF72 family)
LQEESYDILSSHGFALCIPISPDYPRVEQMTAPFTYIRFHSGQIRENSCYTDEELRNWAAKIKKWLEGQDLCIYFNNDAFGFAIDNARKLRDYLASSVHTDSEP